MISRFKRQINSSERSVDVIISDIPANTAFILDAKSISISEDNEDMAPNFPTDNKQGKSVTAQPRNIVVQVLGSYELIGIIVCRCPLFWILVSGSRISRTWRDVIHNATWIQQALFFEPRLRATPKINPFILIFFSLPLNDDIGKECYYNYGPRSYSDELGRDFTEQECQSCEDELLPDPQACVRAEFDWKKLEEDPRFARKEASKYGAEPCSPAVYRPSYLKTIQARCSVVCVFLFLSLFFFPNKTVHLKVLLTFYLGWRKMLPTNPSTPEIWYTCREQGLLGVAEGVRTIYLPTEKMQFRPKTEPSGKRLEHIYKTSQFL